MSIHSRKNSHIQICLKESVQSEIMNGFEKYRLIHEALPEKDFHQFDISTSFLGKKISAPLMISSMTGGTESGETINRHLVEAAVKEQIPFAIGSMRIYLEQNRLPELRKLRDHAIAIPILANIGAVQLNYGLKIDQIKQIVDSVEADALILHLNAIQEVFQHAGDLNFSDLLRKIEKVRSQSDVPVIIKEVGFGFSVETAGKLREIGIEWLDIAGAGGTSWIKVEAARDRSEFTDKMVAPFYSWGIPTAISLARIHQAYPDMNLIASGGIRNGVEVCKAEYLGARLSGIAIPLLKPALESAEAACNVIDQFKFQYRTAKFCSSGIESI